MTNEQRKKVLEDFIEFLYNDGFGLREGSEAIPQYDARYEIERFLRETTVKCDEQCSRCC